MSTPSKVEFVCYHEGGIIDIQQALDHFIEPTLDEVLKAQREGRWLDEPEDLEATFRPALRALPLYRSPDDLLSHVLFRDKVEIRPFQLREKSYLLSSPTIERVYPFKKPSQPKAIGSENSDTVEARESFRRVSELTRAASEATLKNGDRLVATRQRSDPGAASDAALQPIIEGLGNGAVELDSDRTVIDVTPTRPATSGPPRRVGETSTLLSRPHSQNLDMVVSNRRVVEQLSFHDMLASRSRHKDDVQPRSILPKPIYWSKVLTKIASDLGLFGGFGMIGAGILSVIRREPIENGAGPLILGGVALAGTILLIRIIAKKDKSLLVHVRA